MDVSEAPRSFVFTSSTTAAVIILLGLIGLSILTIYRLCFSPIAHFPGPKLAAATFWYEFYYDVILGGQYYFKIKRLHEQYGSPVIRINPKELHVITPSFADELYAGATRNRDKWAYKTKALGVVNSTFTTDPHDLHRLRRSALSPFFAKGAVRGLQPLIDSKIAQLLNRLDGAQNSGRNITFNHALAAFTNDIATEYAFGWSYNRLGKPDFDPSFHDACVAGLASAALMVQMPWIMKTLKSMPEWLAIKIYPSYAQYILEQKNIRAQAFAAMNVPVSLDNKTYLEHRTIFREILDSKLPPHEKSLSRLAEDAAVTVAAGTLTTAWTLSVATYFLLSNPYILKKLKDELYAAFSEGSHIPLVEIEKLPYLGACIQEALRLSGATNRLTRIAPDETMVVRHGMYEWRIPPGTPTSMTIPLLQEDETIFPNPKIYRPERWIENPRLDKYLLSFGRGSRICAGINLAYAELYLVIGNLFRTYGSRECRHPGDKGVLELFDTSIRDVESVADKTIPGVWEGSKGIRLRVFE